VTTYPVIATVPFTDGVERPIFLDAHGRQYVIDDDGNRVYGVWVYVDEPLIVDASNR
jgi:hypothetical protein